jgi:HEAT repeat protein
VTVLSLLTWLLLREREPSYREKKLSVWLEEARRRGETSDLFNDALIETRTATALRAMGADSLPTLLRMVQTRDSAYRRALVKLSEEQPWLWLHTRPLDEVRIKAVHGFAVLGPAAKPALPKLAALLRDQDPDVRLVAAVCLGKIGSADAVPALQKYLDDINRRNATKREGKWLAAWALGAIGPAARPALPQLVLLTNDSDYMVQIAAQAAIVRITGEGLGPWTQALQDTSNTTNWLRAARIVQFIGTKAAPAIPFLLLSLQQTNFAIQENALQALGRIHSRPEVCIPALTPLLQSTNGFICTHTLETLRAFGRSNGSLAPTSELFRCLLDPSDMVRAQASNALRQLVPVAAAKAGIE